MSLSARLFASIKGTRTIPNDAGAGNWPFEFAFNESLTDGTGSGQADLVWADERTLSASATENIDLAGSLTDIAGATLTFAKIKAILIIASRGNTNNVVVGGAASNTFVGPFADATDKISLKPGQMMMIGGPGTGWTVTASTGDILLIANSSSGTSVTYKIIVIGTSA